jgi:hypothetical protein
LEASQIQVTERVPASRKLQLKDAELLLKDAATVIVMKGKKVDEFDLRKVVRKEAAQAMLGPTGNLRAPTVRVGKTFLVGFNEEIFRGNLGGKRS